MREHALKLLESGAKRRIVLRNSCALLGLSAGLAGWGLTAYAHGENAGYLSLDHPYAIPSAAGETHGRVYLRGITNASADRDRLLGASTPVADKVVLHRLLPQVTGLREEPVQAIDLPAKTTTQLRHTGDFQLSLLGLKKPIMDGDKFDMTLRFEHAGFKTVKVWVQTPRVIQSHHSAH